jgi:hypothetical protein
MSALPIEIKERVILPIYRSLQQISGGAIPMLPSERKTMQ